MLEGVGIVGVAEKLVSFPIILNPTDIHVEVIVAQNLACSRLKPLWKNACTRLCGRAYGEQKLRAIDPSQPSLCTGDATHPQQTQTP